MKRFVALVLSSMTLLMVFSHLIIPSKSYAITFSDVDSSHWAYNYITTLADQGVINGYEDGTFKPSEKITYSQFIKLVVACVANDEELKQINEQLQSTSVWYQPYYLFAEENDLSANGISLSELNKNVTRDQMAYMLYKAIIYIDKKYGTDILDVKWLNEITSGENEESLADQSVKKEVVVYSDEKNFNIKKFIKDNGLPDDTEVIIRKESEYVSGEKIAKDDNNLEEYNLHYIPYEEYDDVKELLNAYRYAIETCTKAGLITGYDDGTFKPNNELTRAEVSTIIYRLSTKF